MESSTSMSSAQPGAAAGAEAASAIVPAVAAPIDRELSLLEFNRRVLALAEDPEVPLLERLRFLCIVGSNLDEFFEIRVAGVNEQLRAKLAPPGLTLQEARDLAARMGEEARVLIARQYRVLNEQVLPALAEAGVRLARRIEFTPAEREWVAAFFAQEVRPLLTPIGLDPAHPFPQIVNKSLNFVIELRGNDAFGRDTGIAIVKAPRVLPRVIKMPPEVAGDEHAFVMLSSIIHAHLSDLFPGREVVAYSQFRVTRDADLWIDEAEVKNLRQALQGELPQRQFGRAVRLEVASECPAPLATFLLTQIGLTEADLYRCDGPVNIARLSSLIDQVDIDTLKYEPFVPGLPDRLRDAPDILAAVRQHDILLHHPYQSFEPVVDFIRRAAEDDDVVAIKQTVYRTGVNSVLMDTLIEAARRGKEVTVVVELMARFDEEANINWAERLERAGAQVVYGVFGLKTHAKMVLLIRREHDANGRVRLVHYAHLGTGNYHPRTARLYTDFGLLTADPEICSDVNEVFLHITSLARAARLKRLLLAPFTMQRRVLELIRRETRHAQDGKPARIIAKMNALVDEGVIRALYAASAAGVAIDLIVRGACALRPGVPGISDNIRVRSILGRFLEHHRVWYFDNDGTPDVWLASADWMARNLFRRIEVAFPVRDPALRKRVVDEGLKICLADNRQAWELDAQGQWSKAKPRKRAKQCCAQEALLAGLRESDLTP
ncbi:MAG: polyphosphate kinase 1 [Burkholderiales bacterium]|nr:polyphosphate kinase 1 [Burkholderiales bacterium]